MWHRLGKKLSKGIRSARSGESRSEDSGLGFEAVADTSVSQARALLQIFPAHVALVIAFRIGGLEVLLERAKPVLLTLLCGERELVHL